MTYSKPHRIKSINEGYRLLGLQNPHHPLISVIDVTRLITESKIDSLMFDFYSVTLKRGCDNLLYGQQKYDFDGGLMAFMSPGQILSGKENGLPPNLSGWMMFIHPDFLWNTTLAKKIKQFDYFAYSANEALFLSEKEEQIIDSIVSNIILEFNNNIDKFSQDVVIAQLDLLFTYAQRFYERQFISRKITNSSIFSKLEDLLDNYFKNEDLRSKGLPSVQYFADNMNLSVKYLSSMLKQLTGKTTQEHIHEKLIEIAKERLSTTSLTVSEIAYDLGFEHSQSFSKLFKSKTNQSPLEFRASFN